LGRIFVDMGVVSREQVREALHQKSEEILYNLFEWDDGIFEFRTGEGPSKRDIDVRFDTSSILWEAARRKDEMREIRKIIPDTTTVLEKTEKELGKPFADDPLAVRLLEFTDGRRTVAELRLLTHSSEFNCHRTLSQLARAGYLRATSATRIAAPAAPDATVSSPDAAPREGTGPSSAAKSPIAGSELAQLGQALLVEARFGEALETLRQAEREEPERGSVRLLRELAEMRFREHTYATDLPPQAILQLVFDSGQLMAERLTPEEYFLLSRINGRWNVKSLVRTSPMSEVDVLWHLTRLLNRRIIRVVRPLSEG
jgi:hypothetical protein